MQRQSLTMMRLNVFLIRVVKSCGSVHKQLIGASSKYLYAYTAAGISVSKDKGASWEQEKLDTDASIIILFYETGMRLSELIGLDVDDVNFIMAMLRYKTPIS